MPLRVCLSADREIPTKNKNAIDEAILCWLLLPSLDKEGLGVV